MALTNVQRALAATEGVEDTQGPQKFTQAELPDPESAIAAGLLPQRIPPSQIIDE